MNNTQTELSQFLNKNWTFLMWFTIAMIYFVLAMRGKLPSVYSFKHALSALNDKAGNILILAGFAIYFFVTGMKVFYYGFNLIAEGKMEPSNAIFLMCVQWVTGVAFGGAFGALLKSMTGSDSLGVRAGDPPRPLEKKSLIVEIGSPPGAAAIGECNDATDAT